MLKFESDAKFLNDKTLEIQLLFKEKLQVSLYSESDRIKVNLWGAFVSKSDFSILSDSNRTI